MKFGFTFLLSLLGSSLLFAQPDERERRVSLKALAIDSFRIPLDHDYLLIEDSCATIFRYGRFNVSETKFTGRFRDVLVADTGRIVLSGNYDAQGQKQGEFVQYHRNGKLRGKGMFRNNRYVGRWELYYENGNPELSFDAQNAEYKIIDWWNEAGKQSVKNGKGSYKVPGALYWEGKLENGKAEGKWQAYLVGGNLKSAVYTEYFKNGKFVKGNKTSGEYSDSSRFELVNKNSLSLINAEEWMMGMACNRQKVTISSVRIIGVNYRGGAMAFQEEMRRLLDEYLAKVNLNFFDELELSGEVSEKGKIVNLEYKRAFDPTIANGIISQLRMLPLLQPATKDGKPVLQKMYFRFKFNASVYSFTYGFFPVE